VSGLGPSMWDRGYHGSAGLPRRRSPQGPGEGLPLANRPTANVAFLVERAGAVKDRGGARIDIRRILSPPGLLAGVVASVAFVFAYLAGAPPASADRTLNSGHRDGGFVVPEGETWTFNPNADTTITSGGNVIVRGTLVMKPANGNV